MNSNYNEEIITLLDSQKVVIIDDEFKQIVAQNKLDFKTSKIFSTFDFFNDNKNPLLINLIEEKKDSSIALSIFDLSIGQTIYKESFLSNFNKSDLYIIDSGKGKKIFLKTWNPKNCRLFEIDLSLKKSILKSIKTKEINTKIEDFLLLNSKKSNRIKIAAKSQNQLYFYDTDMINLYFNHCNLETQH